MKFFSSFFLLSLIISIITTITTVNGNSSNSKSTETYAQTEKRKELIKEPKRNNVITITSTKHFKNLLASPTRSHETIILFTASTKVGCHRCPETEEMFREVAKAGLEHGENRLFFAQIMFDENQELFSHVFKLNHAPVILYIPSDSRHDGSDLLKLPTSRTFALSSMEDYTADSIASWVTARTGIKVEIYHSPFFRIFAFTSFLLSLLVSSKWILLHVVPWARNHKWFFFQLSILAYGLGVSGTIYSFLRGVPAVGVDGNGKPQFFASDRHQYLYEGYIVGFLLVSCSAAVVIAAQRVKPISFIDGKMWLIIRAFSVLLFGLFFRAYVMLYLTKAGWYAHGVKETGKMMVMPWLPLTLK
jgi:hypothetical protein